MKKVQLTGAYLSYFIMMPLLRNMSSVLSQPLPEDVLLSVEI